MAFPFIFEENYELGTKGGWDTETDTDSVLDFPHYTEMARFAWSQAAPYRGAFCCRIALNGGTADATLTEGSIDIADAATASLRFWLYFAPDFTATADDDFQLFEWQQAGGTVEASLGIRIIAATQAITIGVGDGTAPSAYGASKLSRNRWYCIEATMKASTTGAGTLTLYVDGASVVALASLTQAAAVGQGVLGIQNHLATTTGTILFDWFTFDDLRLYPSIERWPDEFLLTLSEHVILGAGEIANVTLLKSAATDEIVKVFDTDRGITTDATNTVVELLSGGSTAEVIDPAGMPVTVKRGAFVQLSGTAPRARVNVSRNYCTSPGRIRDHALRRTVSPLEVP